MPLFVPALIVFAGGIWGLDRGSMWQDEATTAAIAGRSLPQLWHTLGSVDGVHGAYYLLVHELIVVFGGTLPLEVLIRIPSLLGAAAAAAGVAAVARATWSPAAGLLSGSVFAVLPVVSRYAQEGRSYALVAAAVIWGTYFLVRGRWVAYAIALAAACLLNLFAVFVLPAHAVALLLGRAGAPAFRRWALAVLAGLVPAVPVAWVAGHQTAQVSWLTRPGWPDVRALLTGWAGGKLPLAALGVLCAAGVAVGLAGLLPRRRPFLSREEGPPARQLLLAGAGGPQQASPVRDSGPSGPGVRDAGAAGSGKRRGEGTALVSLPALALAVAVLPPVALLAVSQFHPLYQDRYVLYATAGLAWLAGAALAALAALRKGAIVVAAALVMTLGAFTFPAQQQVRQVNSRADDPAAAARVVADGARKGDAVIFLPSVRRLVAEAYPECFSGVRDVALKSSGAESGTLAGREIKAEQVAAALKGVDRVWVVSRSYAHSADLTAPTDRAKRDELRKQFTQTRITRVLGYAVRLYVRKT
jgi:mannosyltransferase